jgi:Na+/proline symporter
VYSISVLAHDQIGMGISLTSIIAMMTFVIILYTVLGGLWAVLTTDLLQFFVLTIVTLIALPVVLKAVGGLDEFINKAPQGFFNLAQNPADYADPGRVKFTWNYFLWWTIMQLFYICSMWELIQRFQSCPSEKDAKKSGWLVVGLYILMPIFWLVPLMIYRIIDSGFIDLADPLNTKKAEIVYVAMIQRFLPAGLTGLALAAMFSATGSMVNSSLNVMSSVITKDFYSRFIRKHAPEKELVFVGRAVIFLLGIAVVFLASNIYRWGGVVEYFFKIIPIVVGPLAVPFLWGVITRKSGAISVWLAVLLGVVISSIMQFLLPMWGYEFTLAGHLFASTAVPLAVLFIGAFLEKRDKDKRELVDDLFAKMIIPIDEASKTIICKPAIRLIGILTMLCGLFLLQLVWFIQQWKGFIAACSIIVVITGFWFWFNNREKEV